MGKKDIIFAIICGLAVAWIAMDFFVKYRWIFLVILPILSVVGLLLCEKIGKKYKFVQQAGKFALAGAFADVVDIKIFQLLIIFAPFSLSFKAISFVIATIIKYLANKHWSFYNGEEGKPAFTKGYGEVKEVAQFFLVTLGGLVIDVVSFYYLARVKVGISTKLWIELSIIFAALIAAVWNFVGYKFFVFKK